MRCFLAFLGLSTVSTFAAEPQLDTTAVQRIGEMARSKWKAPGLAMVVVQQQVPPLVLGLGVRQLGQPDPITPETLFPLASCSKAFTSTLLAQLVDEGRIDWTDPVVKHWPDFKLSNAQVTQQVTLEDLLSHRSGLMGHDLLWYRAPWTIDESLKKLAQVPLEGRFREQYHYSSLPVMAAGRLAERVTGKTWPELIRTNLAKSLRLEPITFTSAEMLKIDNRARGHRRTTIGTVESMPDYPLKEANPAGSISVTPKSLVPWLQLQLSEGLGPSGERLVSKKNLLHTRQAMIAMPKDAMIGPLYPESREVHYCLGWVKFDYQGMTVFSHGGVIDGFRCQLTFIPDKQLGLALFNNLHDSKLNIGLTYALLDLFQSRQGPDWLDRFWKLEESEVKQKQEFLAARDRQRTLNTRPSLPLASYAGEYTHPAYGTCTLQAQSGQLVWTWSSFSSELEHYQFDQFRVKSGYFQDQLIEFGGQNGEVKRVRTVGQVFTRS